MKTKRPKRPKKTTIKEKEIAKSRHARFRQELVRHFFKNDEAGADAKPDSLSDFFQAKDFLIIPQALVYSGSHLSLGEKMTWLAIFSHNWDRNPRCRVSWAGRERLALLIGKSPRQVSSYLSGLRRKGLLRTRPRLDKTSLYLLANPPESWVKETKNKLEELKAKKAAERRKKEKMLLPPVANRRDLKIPAHYRLQESAR